MQPPRAAASETTALTQSAGRELEAMNAVLARAETDAEFRRQLLIEPRRIIYDTFGIRIPEQFRIRFIERSADVDALVVLPDLRTAAHELSDGELEHVTGGANAHNAHLAWKNAAGGSSRHHSL
jgi:hypothetical protein